MNKHVNIRLTATERAELQNVVEKYNSFWVTKAAKEAVNRIHKKIVDSYHQLAPNANPDLACLSLTEVNEEYSKAKARMQELHEERAKRFDRDHPDTNLLINLLFDHNHSITNVVSILNADREAFFTWYYHGDCMVIDKDGETVWEKNVREFDKEEEAA